MYTLRPAPLPDHSERGARTAAASFTVGTPKGKRKGFPFCFRVDGAEEEAQGLPGFKMVLAADDEKDMDEWMLALHVLTQPPTGLLAGMDDDDDDAPPPPPPI